MRFGTVIVTKDRNVCLGRTVKGLLGTELTNQPIVVLNNGSEADDPRQVIDRHSFPCDYIDVGFNPGIVGSRILAHRVAQSRGWTHYCFLQDDFELKAEKPWLRDTLEFVERFQIDYCRLTIREAALGDSEHWVKGRLRELTGTKRWNCSHVQSPKPERVGETDFALTDKHYSDWAHIMSAETSALLFDVAASSFQGDTVTDLLLGSGVFGAFHGALRSEFDVAVKHWIAYSLGLTSATGIVMERCCWSGLFDHFTGESARGRRELPDDTQLRQKLSSGWVPGQTESTKLTDFVRTDGEFPAAATTKTNSSPFTFPRVAATATHVEFGRRLAALVGLEWPTNPADPAENPHGWWAWGVEQLFKKNLSSATRLVVELGAWQGLSARKILSFAPEARLITIDHFLGSIEHQSDPPHAAMLPTLKETCQANLYPFRDRVSILQDTTVGGLRRIQTAGLGMGVDVVYLDASHDTKSVLTDLRAVRDVCPRAILIGDDWLWETVQAAVRQFSEDEGSAIEFVQNGWCLGPPAFTYRASTDADFG